MCTTYLNYTCLPYPIDLFYSFKNSLKKKTLCLISAVCLSMAMRLFKWDIGNHSLKKSDSLPPTAYSSSIRGGALGPPFNSTVDL